MKLQPDKSDTQTVTAHGPGWVAINNEKFEESVVIGSRGRHTITTALLGSISLGVLRHARRPVLIVKTAKTPAGAPA